LCCNNLVETAGLCFWCRLRKAVEYWKEQAGLLTADAKAAADLFEIENRRCDSPAAAAAAADGTPGGASCPPTAAAGFGSTSSSVISSRPGTAVSRGGLIAAIASELQVAAGDAASPMVEPYTDTAADSTSIGEREPSCSSGSVSEL
jgi:hypothetical protein